MLGPIASEPMRSLRWLTGLLTLTFALAGCSNNSSNLNPAALKIAQQAGSVSNKHNAIFLAEVDHYAPEVTYRHAVGFEGLGHSICLSLISGATIGQEVTTLGKEDVAADVGEGILHGAVEGYCPRFQRSLSAWVNSQSSH